MSVVSAALGACIGSFLNVVIYRLPRASRRQPAAVVLPFVRHNHRRLRQHPRPQLSCCCEAGAAVVTCRSRFSIRSSNSPPRCCSSPRTTFYRREVALGVGAWPQDGVLVAIHWICWAGLLATAVMDIEAYHLDIRVTWTVAVVGIIGHVLWTPDSSAGWIRPGPVLSAGVIVAAFTARIALFVLIHRERLSPIEEPPPESEPSAEPAASDATAPAGRKPGLLLALLLGAALVVAYTCDDRRTREHRPCGGKATSAASTRYSPRMPAAVAARRGCRRAHV